MSLEIETEDGEWTFRVFSSLYIDWGLQIDHNHRDENGSRETYCCYYSPHCLSRESYGFDWVDEDENELEEGKSWSDEEWKESILAEVDDHLEAFVARCETCEKPLGAGNVDVEETHRPVLLDQHVYCAGCIGPQQLVTGA